MTKTNPPDDEELQVQEMPLGDGPSFEELMMLVFSGPMRCDDVGQDDETKQAHNEEADSDNDQD